MDEPGLSITAEQRAASARALLFDPPREAEPSVAEEREGGEDAEKPTVLSKLQKWADYPSVGDPVQPTRFLPMKTPMSCEILHNWSLPDPPRFALTVPELLRSQAAAGRDVGLIIDLANHDCLYSDDLPEALEYAHVQLVAKALPPREAIDEVERVARAFWAAAPDRYVAIHCAYGFNRTGFVVCSYLCQACGMSVPQALASFARARPPGVKHGKFVDELYTRYGGDAGAASGAGEAAEAGAAAPAGVAAAATASDRSSGQMSGRERSARSTPISISRRSASGQGSGRSLLVEPRERRSGEGDGVDTAGSSRDGTGAGGAVEDGPPSAARIQDFSALAKHFYNGLKRETSLGLAKALHEDFGVHDSTPTGGSHALVRLVAEEEAAAGASHLAARTCGEDGRAAGSDEGDAAAAPDENEGLAASGRPVAVHAGAAAAAERGAARGAHVCTPPRSQRPPLLVNGVPAGTPPSASTATPSWGASGGRVDVGGSGGGGRLPRNMSGESDNHSLGFGTREALLNLRGGGGGGGGGADLGPQPPPHQQGGDGLLRADTLEQLSELDPANWLEPAAKGGGPPGRPSPGWRRRRMLGCRVS